MKKWIEIPVGIRRPGSWVSAFVIALVAIIIAASQIGCGGSGTFNLPPLPTFVPGSVSDTDRDAAYATVETFFQSVRGQKDAAAQIVAKMKTMKQFAAAEISQSGDAVGWFTDGHMYVCFTTDPPIRPAPSFKPQSSQTQTHVKPKDLPGAPKAHFVNAFEPARPDIAAAVIPLMQDKGYNTVQLFGGVKDYQTISNAGLLFVHAHGLISTDKNRVTHFWYSTSDTPTPQLDTDFAAYWQSGTIATGSADVWQSDGTVKTEHRYIISDQFLHDSGITFAKNAVWLSQSCSSFNPYILKSVLDPSVGFPGVAVYGGWTLPEDSYDSTDTSSFIFDRMLGLNEVPPVQANTPPPADFGTMIGLLATTIRPVGGQTYDVSATNDGTALYKFQSRAGVSVPTIIPAITDVAADSDKQTLTLSGFFGAPTGLVTLAGTSLNIQSWSETSIVVDLPSTTGPLVVKSLGESSTTDNLSSNVINYTGLIVNLTPPGASLQHKEQKTFSVAASTGTIPQGAKYRWTLTGKGSLAGGNSFTSSSNSVSYTAPNVDTADNLKVEVLNPSGTVAAKAVGTISVGNTGMTYTVTGDVSSQAPSPLVDGTFTRPFYISLHYALTSQDNTIVEFVDPVTTDSMMVVFTVSPGVKFSQGQSFTYGTNKVGGFHFLPGTGHSSYIFNASGGGGTMTITSVTDNGNGTFNVGFNGSATDLLGCTIAGSGSFVAHSSYDQVP